MLQATHTKTEEARAILEQAHAKLTQERATSGTEALVPTSTSPSFGSAPAHTTQFNEVVKLNTWLSAQSEETKIAFIIRTATERSPGERTGSRQVGSYAARAAEPSLAEELEKTQQIPASLEETEKKAREEKTRFELLNGSFGILEVRAQYCEVLSMCLALICVGTVSGRLKGGNLLLTNDQLFFQGVIKTSPGRSFLSEVPKFSARGKSKI